MLPASDGVIVLRTFEVADRPVIIQGRDVESERWLGAGSPEPSPTACIEVGGFVVGWIDADSSPAWLEPGEANIGYSVFPVHRGNGYAARAVRLLAAELAVPGVNRALLVIDVDNHASIRVARAAGARVLTSRRLSPFPTSIVYSLALTPRAGPD